mgnify:CR=1 FL=1
MPNRNKPINLEQIKKDHLNGRKRMPKGTFSTEREKTIYHRFGLLPHELKELCEKSEGKCAICEAPPESERNARPNLSIDHCHTTGRIRGLLCTRCNIALGSFDDNEDYLLKAIEYIK